MKNPGSLFLLLLMVLNVWASSESAITLSASKESLFVGESFELRLKVKRCDAHSKILPIFTTPKIRHIWLKKVFKTMEAEEGSCTVSVQRYAVTAQQDGLLKIPPVEVNLAFDVDQRDAWGNMKTERYWEKHYSNSLELNVKRLTVDTALVGDFSVALDIPNREAAANAAIDAAIVVEGVGNFEDLSVVLPVIKGVTTFTQEPTLDYNKSTNHEIWRQKVTFTSEDNFTIDSISLRYFDPDDERLKVAQTDAISIHIVGDKSSSILTLTKPAEVSKSSSTLWLVVIGVLAFLSLIVAGIKVSTRRKGGKKVSYRNHKALLQLLLLHKEDEGIKEIIEKLEASVYEGEEMVVAPKELKRLVRKYQQK